MILATIKYGTYGTVRRLCFMERSDYEKSR